MTARRLENLLIPIAGISLVLICIGSFVVAWGTMDWRYLIVTGICYVILVKSGG